MMPHFFTTAERRALRRQAFRRIHEEWSRPAIMYPFLDQQFASLRFWRWALPQREVSP